jgi:hypothetical protein
MSLARSSSQRLAADHADERGYRLSHSPRFCVRDVEEHRAFTERSAFICGNPRLPFVVAER